MNVIYSHFFSFLGIQERLDFLERANTEHRTFTDSFVKREDPDPVPNQTDSDPDDDDDEDNDSDPVDTNNGPDSDTDNEPIVFHLPLRGGRKPKGASTARTPSDPTPNPKGPDEEQQEEDLPPNLSEDEYTGPQFSEPMTKKAVKRVRERKAELERAYANVRLQERRKAWAQKRREEEEAGGVEGEEDVTMEPIPDQANGPIIENHMWKPTGKVEEGKL